MMAAGLLMLVTGHSTDAVLKAVQIAHQANLDNLRYGTLAFRVSYGTPDKLDDARSGNFSAKHVSKVGTYVFSGRKLKYECVFSPEDMYASFVKEGTRTTRYLSSFRYCGDGATCLEDPCQTGGKTPVLRHRATIRAAWPWHWEYMRCPLRLGHVGNAGSELLVAIAGLQTQSPKAESETLESAAEGVRLGDAETVTLTFASPGMKQTFWVDLARGGIPLRHVVDLPSRPPSRVERNYHDIREVRQGVWFPFRETLAIYNVAGKVLNAKSLDVTAADFSKRPSDQEIMTLHYDQPISCNDHIRKLHYPSATRWCLASLPDQRAKGVFAIAPAPPPQSPAPELAGPIRARPRYWPHVLGIMGIAALIYGIRRAMRCEGNDPLR